MRHLLTFVLLTLLAQPVAAQTPAFNPQDWRGLQAGQPTQVLTIGTAHLSQLDHVISPEMLAPLLDKLAAYNPQIINHEGLSGEQCDTLRRYAARYPDAFDTYCWPTDSAEHATGLTVPAAMAEIEKELAAWPDRPTPAQRRHLAAVFLAAGDRPSARVQWLQLPPGERALGDGIDETLLKILTPVPGKPNETTAIAVALAVRLGHQRVYAVDDHTADSVQGAAGPGFDPFMQKLWASETSPVIEADRRMSAAMNSGSSVLDYYRFINQPTSQLEYITTDHQRAMRTPSPEGFGRAYFAWWEVRNLRMVSNVRASFATHPGARVLNIVGVSHKPYYDAYLAMMSDVTLVDAEAILK